MNKLKHTPGPWEAEHIKEENYYLVENKKEDGIIAEVYQYKCVHRDYEEKYNAHLIAVAPEMLECLIEDIKKAIKHWYCNWDYDYDNEVNYKKNSEKACLKENQKKVKLIEKATGLKINDVIK